MQLASRSCLPSRQGSWGWHPPSNGSPCTWQQFLQNFTAGAHTAPVLFRAALFLCFKAPFGIGADKAMPCWVMPRVGTFSLPSPLESLSKAQQNTTWSPGVRGSTENPKTWAPPLQDPHEDRLPSHWWMKLASIANAQPDHTRCQGLSSAAPYQVNRQLHPHGGGGGDQLGSDATGKHVPSMCLSRCQSLTSPATV